MKNKLKVTKKNQTQKNTLPSNTIGKKFTRCLRSLSRAITTNTERENAKPTLVLHSTANLDCKMPNRVLRSKTTKRNKENICCNNENETESTKSSAKSTIDKNVPVKATTASVQIDATPSNPLKCSTFYSSQRKQKKSKLIQLLSSKDCNFDISAAFSNKQDFVTSTPDNAAKKRVSESMYYSAAEDSVTEFLSLSENVPDDPFSLFAELENPKANNDDLFNFNEEIIFVKKRKLDFAPCMLHVVPKKEQAKPKAPKPQKMDKKTEAEFNTWANQMNEHFQEIDDSDLVID